mgnify:CR=1 FL=1
MNAVAPSLDERGNANVGFMAVLKLHHGPVFHRALLPNSEGFQFLGIRPDGSTIPGEVRLSTEDPNFQYYRVRFPSNPELGIRDICAWKHLPKSSKTKEP